jgi:hypothetical protein
MERENEEKQPNKTSLHDSSDNFDAIINIGSTNNSSS